MAWPKDEKQTKQKEINKIIKRKFYFIVFTEIRKEEEERCLRPAFSEWREQATWLIERTQHPPRQAL